MKNLILSSCLLSITLLTNAQQRVFPELRGPYLGQRSPGRTPEIFAPDILVRERGAHSVIVFSSNGREAYWCNNGIWHSALVKNHWTNPKLVPFSKQEYSDDAPFLSPDGKRLFFASKRPTCLNDTSRKENIWVVDVLDSIWSEPRLLPPVINDMFQHWQFSIDNNGTIYFAHRLNGDINNDNDIYYSKYENGRYISPDKLSRSVNSLMSEQNPFISPEGDYLIFTRLKDRRPFNGGLFISFRMNDDSWSEACPLSGILQFRYGGNCPFVSQDGRYLFFLDSYSGNWQRYWVSAELLKELKPKEL